MICEEYSPLLRGCARPRLLACPGLWAEWTLRGLPGKYAHLGYFEAQSRLSLRLITYFHLLTEAVETKL